MDLVLKNQTESVRMNIRKTRDNVHLSGRTQPKKPHSKWRTIEEIN